MKRPAILFLDTNILLDCSSPECYRLRGRAVTLMVIPEVMRELRGLTRSRARGQGPSALRALATLESLARRPGSAIGIPFGHHGASIRILLDAPDGGDGAEADTQLVLRAQAEQFRQPGAMVAVVTRDWGVAELARAERVKSILLRGPASAAEMERGLAEHDSVLDIEL